jgi:uncharacterized protein (DUF302 family)
MKSFSTTVDATLDAVEPRVRDALAAEGFGVLTEIDVAATLRAKLGVERAPLKILGACNPNFAHRALLLDPTVSLLLPCNVVLEAVDGATTVSVVDPRALIDEEEFRPLADEAADRLRRVVDVVGQR